MTAVSYAEIPFIPLRIFGDGLDEAETLKRFTAAHPEYTGRLWWVEKLRLLYYEVG